MDINNAKKFYLPAAVFFITSLLFLQGCADNIAGINPLDVPAQVIQHPLGTNLVKVGMHKNEVVSIWSEPDQINRLESIDQWQTPREEWVYIAQYSKIIPIDKEYIARNKYLVFDGSTLVSISDKSRLKAVEIVEIKERIVEETQEEEIVEETIVD